ncbi:AAA family ATPase [Microcoleus sp. LAD1_D3]|uniref:AAA family ATPase n=1 Tax=Microcoleus sp. LAD1_D3 TaxID=2819365 RepID=UPI002FCEAB5A
MKHLDNLTIHQFRGLRDLTLQDLGQINLLVGANNSGKTSVLEAISTHCLNAVLTVDTVTPFSYGSEELLSEATFQRFKSEVIKLLQGIDSGIIDLAILSHRGQRPSLYIDHKQLGILPLSAVGDGVRRLLCIALRLSKVRGGVLLIDEIEKAIHTDSLCSSFTWMVQWCQRLDVQLFATTHSLETVDAMLGASDTETDLVLYRLEKWELQTKVIRLEREILQRVREDLGQEVRV